MCLCGGTCTREMCLWDGVHSWNTDPTGNGRTGLPGEAWAMGPLLAGEEGRCPPAAHPMGICTVSAWLAVACVPEGLVTH